MQAHGHTDTVVPSLQLEEEGTTRTFSQLKRHIEQMLAPVTLSPEQATAETQWILETLFSQTPEKLYAHGAEQVVSQEDLEPLERLLDQRVQHRVPLQYLLGETTFFGLPFKVTPAVLIPRPESERLVEEAILLCHRYGYQSIVDVGTGSGAIAVALAHTLSLEGIQVTATDISPEALEVARENALQNEVNIRFLQGNWFQSFPLGERFDCILSNPPYIHRALENTLLPEVLHHEPQVALFPPDRSTYFYEKAAEEVGQYLNPGGSLLMELGHHMAEPVKEIFKQAGFQNLTVAEDYQGYPRILIMTLPTT